ncbi:hypothetical protein ACFWBN_14640 [Streptomyces sp. NPDC059989]|uniref:hypothetical protein n=1 Tax=Streptomyces sp. NPDC059989 TaxID=3347026 RepID=UPI0036B51671
MSDQPDSLAAGETALPPMPVKPPQHDPAITPPPGYGYPPPYGTQIAAPPTPAPRNRRLVPAAAGLLAGAILGSGITYLATAPEDTPQPKEPGVFTLTGTMTARGEKSSIGRVSSRENGCSGTGGYQDMRSGTTVTVYDAQGTVVHRHPRRSAVRPRQHGPRSRLPP